MKLFSAQQIRALDDLTIRHELIASLDLMERACRAFASLFTQWYDNSNRIGIICGTGNNGGDGLGIARILHDWNYNVTVWIVRTGDKLSPDFETNLHRLPQDVERMEIASTPNATSFSSCNILIDALLGTGLSRQVTGLLAEVIQIINNTNAIRISVDVPSGLLSDKHSTGTIVKAHHTISFQFPKLAFFFPENFQYVGQWHVVSIGIHKKAIEETETPFYYTTKKTVRKLIKPRSKFDHKGTYGHALLIAGSLGKMGAAVLASQAALRSGLGLLTVHAPRCGYSILQQRIPEAMVSIDPHENLISSIPDVTQYRAVGVGPGIGTSKETHQAIRELIEKYRSPMVIDADGINILSQDPSLLHLIPPNSILTPHPGEFSRLVGTSANDFERLENQIRFSKQTKTILVLKGAHTSIAFPDGSVWFNSTGNPGMAKGGNGDVLTGILTGLLCRGYSSEETAKIGVFLHGLAGDLAKKRAGVEAMLATDIIAALPEAFEILK